MDAHLFLREVAKEYSIPYDELKSRVSEVFTHEQLENLDDDYDYFVDTEHFKRFVRQNDLKKVEIGTVVLYLNGVILADSNIDLSFDLEDANKRMRLMKEVLFATGLALAGLSILF